MDAGRYEVARGVERLHAGANSLEHVETRDWPRIPPKVPNIDKVLSELSNDLIGRRGASRDNLHEMTVGRHQRGQLGAGLDVNHLEWCRSA